MNLSSSVSFLRKRESSGVAAKDTAFAGTAYEGGAAVHSSPLSLVTNQVHL